LREETKVKTTKYPIVETKRERNAELVATSTVVVSQPGGGEPFIDTNTIRMTNNII
jgi:hypothetical protein